MGAPTVAHGRRPHARLLGRCRPRALVVARPADQRGPYDGPDRPRPAVGGPHPPAGRPRPHPRAPASRRPHALRHAATRRRRTRSPPQRRLVSGATPGPTYGRAPAPRPFRGRQFQRVLAPPVDQASPLRGGANAHSRSTPSEPPGGAKSRAKVGPVLVPEASRPLAPPLPFSWLRNGASGLRVRHDFPLLLLMIRGVVSPGPKASTDR